MNYIPAFPPWSHQGEAEARWGDREVFALLMAMRTGKTKVVLDHYGRLELAQRLQNLCVIAPAGVYKTWEEACDEHFSIDLKSRYQIHTWESTAGVVKRKALHDFMCCDHMPRVLLMNVEALSSVKMARQTTLDFLRQGKVLTAVDEVTCIKNPSSKRTKFINREVANESDQRVILSGLPAPKSPLDLYSEFEFLDWRILGFRSYYAFRARYAVMIEIPVGGRNIPIVKGFRDVEEIAERIGPHSYRVKLEDCYDVPPKIYTKREVKMTAEQQRLYNEMKQFCTARLNDMGDHVTATIVIAQMTRLHQILCGHTVDENGVEHEISENRTDELIEMLADYDGKAVIWASYDPDVRKISAALEKAFGEGCVARFWGGNKTTREAEEKRFKYDPTCTYMVATPDAGGRGRDWAIAKLIIYYSNRDNLDHRDQSEERPQAVGKFDAVTYCDLYVPGTVDEKFLYAMRAKINLSATVTGDQWRQWVV